MTPEEKKSGRTEGDRLKEKAFAVLAAHRDRLLYDGRRALLQHALATGRATADDVREVVELPPGVSPKAFGPLASPLATAGIVRSAGFEKSCRPLAHSRPVTVWELANQPAAEKWLRDHPPLTPIEPEGGGK